MAKKKKKLKKQLAAAVATVAIVIGVGGFGAWKFYRGLYQPAQLKKTGRELMLKGDYAGAYSTFGRAAGRLTTDMEYLGWFYETSLHQTSLTDPILALRNSGGLLDMMLAARPNDIPTITKKIAFDLDRMDLFGVNGFDAEQAKRMNDLATRVLAEDPANAIALRAQAMCDAMPVFNSNTALTSDDVDVVVQKLRTRLDADPTNGELLWLYTFADLRLRETLVRERAIDIGPDAPRTQEMFADLDARVEKLNAFAADAGKPAELRAVAYARSSRCDEVLLRRGFIESGEKATASDKATSKRIYDRQQSANAQAAELTPPTSKEYVGLRIAYADALAQQEKALEAEKVLKDTVDAVPKQWQPRLFLADFYSDRGRPEDALQLVKTDLPPSDELTGMAGVQFYYDRRAVPLRRAFYRLQSTPTMKPDDRAAAVAAAQADYDLALADSKISENEPSALQVKAALQELKLDRTGAAQTLTKALEAGPPDRLKLKIQQQLIALNMAMNQPGAASAMLEQMLKNPSMTPQTQMMSVIQLIDLRIKNGETEGARVLLDTAKRVMPNNPALMALEIQLMTNPEDKLKEFAKLPEDTAPQRAFKLKFASTLGDEPTMRRLAEAMLKENPKAVDVALMWGDFLRHHDKKDEAVQIFQAALEKNPDDKTLPLMIRDTQAVTDTEKADVKRDVLRDPYQRALYEADQARQAGNYDEFLKKLIEAEPLDIDKDGTATERMALVYMALGKIDEAGKAIDRLSKLDRDPAQMRILRARLTLASGKTADALTEIESITNDLPNFAPGWIMRGQVYQATNQPSQAIDAYETALALQPDNLEALRGIIENADRIQKKDVLRRFIDQGLKLTKNADQYFIDWNLRYELAYGDPIVTIDPRLKRRDAKPEDPANWASLAQSYLASANAKDRTGETAPAADYRAKALDVLTQASAKFPKSYGFALQTADMIASGGDVKKATAIIDDLGTKADISPELQSARARFYANHGNTDQAIKILSDLTAGSKVDDSLRVQLAQVQVNAGNIAGALQSLAAATDTPNIREQRLNLLLSTGKVEEAQKLSDDALAKNRNGPTLLMSALVTAQRGHVPEAIKLADEAVALDQESAPAHFTRARLYLSLRPAHNNDAITDLQVVRKNQPGNIDARLMLAERLRAVGRRDESIQELETMERDFDSDRRVAMPLIQAYAGETPPRYARIDQIFANAKRMGGGATDPQLLMLESAVASQRGDNPRAIATINKAHEAAPKDIGLYRNMLTIMLRANAFSDVIAEVDKTQKDNASLYWTYLIRGVALHRLKRDGDAAKEFDRAIGLASAMKESNDAVVDVGNLYAGEYGADAAADWLKAKLPDDIGTRVMQMKLLMNSGKVDKAITLGKLIMESDNFSTLAKFEQIQVLSTMGTAYLTAQPPQPDNARTVFARLNEMEPNNMMTLNNLAYAMTLSGPGPSMQEAVAIAKQANDLAQQTAQPNVYIMDTYGWTLVQAGRTDEGLGVLQQAQEVGEIPEVEYHMGEVYILQNQKEAALANLNSALAKVNQAQQNGKPMDDALAAHINDALSRAKLLP